jgi:hypothetical protein
MWSRISELITGLHFLSRRTVTTLVLAQVLYTNLRPDFILLLSIKVLLSYEPKKRCFATAQSNHFSFVRCRFLRFLT